MAAELATLRQQMEELRGAAAAKEVEGGAQVEQLRAELKTCVQRASPSSSSSSSATSL